MCGSTAFRTRYQSNPVAMLIPNTAVSEERVQKLKYTMPEILAQTHGAAGPDCKRHHRLASASSSSGKYFGTVKRKLQV
jgi:hypothetical protein